MVLVRKWGSLLRFTGATLPSPQHAQRSGQPLGYLGGGGRGDGDGDGGGGLGLHSRSSATG